MRGAGCAPVAVFPIPSVMRCGLLLFAIKIGLRICGFGRTIGWVRRQVQGIPATCSVDASAITGSEYAVAMAGALYPGRAQCLEQSLALYYLLRRAGVSVQFRMGVQPHPFLAHSWIEWKGKPVNDVAEHIEHFARLPDQLP
jgi:Transglutaminase-like superfamily